MRQFGILALFILLAVSALAQQFVVDNRHLAVVLENASVRSSAESTHQQYLQKINDNLQMININVGNVALTQSIIFEGLSNVNSALKNGLAVRDLASIVADITRYCKLSLDLARNEPYLLLFAESNATEIKSRATRLVSDVSDFVLKEGDNVLADYNSRDLLLRHVRYELQLINSLAYGAWKAMFWARRRGIVASLNPFASFISQDRGLVNDILRNAKYLKP